MGDPVQDLLDAVAAREPVDERERVSIERFLAEVPRLERPFDEHSDPVHITASPLVIGRRGIVLLHHKSLGIWVQPGGHIDPGELPWQAALREAIEETGLPVRLLADPPELAHVDVHPGSRGHTHLDLRYVAEAGDADPEPPPHESQHVAWFSFDEALAIADPGLAGILPTLAGVRSRLTREGQMDVVSLHRRTVETFLERVEAIGEEQWSDPTPCSEWDVRELVNHVVGEDRWTAPLLGGSTIAEVGDRFDGDLLGADPAETAKDAAAEAVAAVGYHVPTGGQVHLSYGDEDMAEYVHQLAADHLIHAWDVAAATGGDTSLDPELVDAVAAWFAEREELYRGAGVIGPRVDSSSDDPTHRLLAAFGRNPS